MPERMDNKQKQDLLKQFMPELSKLYLKQHFALQQFCCVYSGKLFEIFLKVVIRLEIMMLQVGILSLKVIIHAHSPLFLLIPNRLRLSRCRQPHHLEGCE